jgi:hypothetical protein
MTEFRTQERGFGASTVFRTIAKCFQAPHAGKWYD